MFFENFADFPQYTPQFRVSVQESEETTNEVSIPDVAPNLLDVTSCGVKPFDMGIGYHLFYSFLIQHQRSKFFDLAFKTTIVLDLGSLHLMPVLLLCIGHKLCFED